MLPALQVQTDGAGTRARQPPPAAALPHPMAAAPMRARTCCGCRRYFCLDSFERGAQQLREFCASITPDHVIQEFLDREAHQPQLY